MKKALIYFEQKLLINVKYDDIKIKQNGHYLYLNKEEQAFVPFNHLIITKEELSVKESDLNIRFDGPSYWGGRASGAIVTTNPCITNIKTY